MYITTLRIPSLQEDFARVVVESLNQMVRIVDRVQPLGFIQALLLRDLQGGALLMTVWQGKEEMRRFMLSEEGKEVMALQANLFPPGKFEAAEYRKTWQAYSFYDDLVAQLSPGDAIDPHVGDRPNFLRRFTMDLNGRWSGMSYDAEGHTAQIELELEQSGDELKGEVSYTPVTTHREESIRGTASGQVKGDRIQLEYTLRAEGGEIAVQFDGRIQPVEVHARASMMGTYQVLSGAQKSLAGGVAIFWLYADQQRG